jgi:hypothetical protein
VFSCSVIVVTEFRGAAKALADVESDIVKRRCSFSNASKLAELGRAGNA